MKNKWFLGLGFLLVFSFFSAELFAQSSSNAQRLVGTWIDEDDIDFSLTLYSNGTGSDIDGDVFKWFATDSKFTIIDEDGDMETFEYNLSPDGRRLFIIDDGDVLIFKKKT